MTKYRNEYFIICLLLISPDFLYAQNSNFSLHENGVTILCPNAEPGEKGIINDIEYLAVDNELLDILPGQFDFSTICTSLISDISQLRVLLKQAYNFSHWDVSSITDMENMFANERNFNSDISHWDVSSVLNMRGMFSGTLDFNSDISTWDVSSVTNMQAMFESSAGFSSDISNWDVSSVTNMRNMFAGILDFNSDITSWDTHKVRWMSAMFLGATDFNQDIGRWDISSVSEVYEMFRNAVSFDQDIGNWNTSSVISMHSMFKKATQFNQDIGRWDVSGVKQARLMAQVFRDASSFNQDLSGWCVPSITQAPASFSTGSALENANKPKWGESCSGNFFQLADNDYTISCDEALIGESGEVDDITYTAVDRTMISQYLQDGGDLSTVCTSKITDMSGLFFEENQFDQDISRWDVSSVTDMSTMFWEANSFNQDISKWNVSNVEAMDYMFYKASAFNQNLTGWCVENFSSEPINFALNSALVEANKPAWGTCQVVNSNENDPLPYRYYLSQNYPNPFNPVTRINYSLPQPSIVTLKVIDTLGKTVAILVDEYKSEGNYSVAFNAINLSSGVYIYSLEAGNFQIHRRMLLIK